tara:strand:- start:3487 stop:3615 length:129 start_codon:yes stop_codon:yes gene_type:complete
MSSEGTFDFFSILKLTTGTMLGIIPGIAAAGLYFMTSGQRGN